MVLRNGTFILSCLFYKPAFEVRRNSQIQRIALNHAVWDRPAMLIKVVAWVKVRFAM